MIGHGGHEVSDYTVEQLPTRIKDSVLQLKTSSTAQLDEQIRSILHEELVRLDEELLQDLSSIFSSSDHSPTTNELVKIIEDMSVDEIKERINDNGPRAAIMRRVMCGSTALIALADPSRKNLWIANLGDCQASEIFQSRKNYIYIY